MATRIGDIQGAAHVSPLAGQTVTTAGIVTAVDQSGGRGFYLQDGGDGNEATSDAVFVFTGSAPTVAVGDRVELTGTVGEFTPGGSATANLSTTQISGAAITPVESGAALPDAEILGARDRRPPGRVIEDDNFGSFDPRRDGIDFYESLEAMRVTVNDPVVVGPTNGFGEIWTLADRGAGASLRSERGGIVLREDDANPERIQIDGDTGVLLGSTDPALDVGDRLSDVTGVVGYNFGNFEVVPTAAYSFSDGGLRRETTRIEGDTETLAVATYNVENLDPNDTDGDSDLADGKFDAIAQQIAGNLDGPDIVGIQEVQDDSGSADDGTVSDDVTLQTLVDAIEDAGGPAYRFASLDPIDGTTGGQPGGNIHNAFLYDPTRVTLDGFEERGAGDPVFDESRLPLIGSFDFAGETVTIVNNHFTSKSGSDPLFGSRQDPALGQPADVGLEQREQQAAFVNGIVDERLAADAGANVMVLGDLNDFEFSSTLEILKGGGDPVLEDLALRPSPRGRYEYVFEGNSQTLDHVLVSNGLSGATTFDPVHVNAEFADQVSDHDPLVAGLDIGPSIIAGTARGERIDGTSGTDEIDARGGDDRVFARAGDDLIDGGRGDDRIDAGAGDDLVLAGAGSDRAFGRGGDDFVFGDTGDDRIEGGAGVDIAAFSGERDGYQLTRRDGGWTVDGGDGRDRLAGIEIAQFDDARVDLRDGGVTPFVASADQVVLETGIG